VLLNVDRSLRLLIVLKHCSAAAEGESRSFINLLSPQRQASAR